MNEWTQSQEITGELVKRKISIDSAISLADAIYYAIVEALSLKTLIAERQARFYGKEAKLADENPQIISMPRWCFPSFS